MTVFKYQTKVELFDTDAAGVIFFSSIFHFTHRALSAFLNEKGISIQERFLKRDYMLPVVHAEADYILPIFTEDFLDIDLEILRIGHSSFTIGYTLLKGEKCAAKAQTVHVAINGNKEKLKLPQKLKNALSL